MKSSCLSQEFGLNEYWFHSQNILMSDFCPCSVVFENIQVKLRIRLVCYFPPKGKTLWFVSLLGNRINAWVQLRVWVAGSGFVWVPDWLLGLGLGSHALDGNWISSVPGENCSSVSQLPSQLPRAGWDYLGRTPHLLARQWMGFCAVDGAGPSR